MSEDAIIAATRTAERALIGALICDRDAIADVVERLQVDAFADDRCRTLYAAVRSCWDNRVPPDPVTVSAELTRRGESQVDQNWIDITQMMIDSPYGCHARHYADLVVEYARQRAIAAAGAEIVRKSFNGGVNPDEALVALRADLERFGAVAVEGPQLYADLIPEWRQDLIAGWEGKRERVETPTGFRILDRTLNGGFRPGELIVLGARPAMGKTSLALQLAHNAARHRRHKQVLFFSAEMSKESLLLRAASEVTGMSYFVVKQEGLSQGFRDRVLDDTGLMELLPVAIDDQSGISTAQMQVRIERAQRTMPVSLVIFDYLELAGDEVKGDSEERRVSEIIRRMKHVAMVTKTPVMVLSQLNRSVESRAGSVPKLADLRYSGAVEANADVVMLLYRHDYYVAQGVQKEDDTRKGQADIIIAKQRNGDTPTLTFKFIPETMSFAEYPS